ncbi:serpentine type 7TM GPCR chemoreceptor srh domain-containing protein [Ditylenchus destructor]|uniref:Serpentine type 7TM GPCR chemoreceptor srh domain-containing protein n=1 Tax=Ditylenchus destructor TaxID=166010 RepID=A0AAD4QSW0_9BILA|nr:serpentine type 7TM GPCR chemoreceptor srh domain-containing protein [Ditylenchus destructor]
MFNDQLGNTLTIDDVYNGTLVAPYSILLYVSAALSTTMFLLTVYTVLRHSTTSMSYYKLFILNCVLWGYLYTLFICQLQPVLLTPLIIGYLDGVLADLFNDVDTDFNLVMATTVFFTNYVTGLILSILYRFLLLRNANRVIRVISRPLGLFVLILCLSIVTCLCSYYFIQNLRVPQEVFMAKISGAYPNLVPVFNDHRMLGYYCEGDNTANVAIFMILPISAMIMLVWFNAFLYTKHKRYGRRLLSRQTIASRIPTTTNAVTTLSANNPTMVQTHRLQTQLQRMNTLQIALLIILLIGPFVLGLICLALKLRHSYAFVIIFTALSSIHCIADNIVVLLFIRPYREFIFRLFYKLFRIRLGKGTWINSISSIIQNPPLLPTMVNTTAARIRPGRITWRYMRRNAEAEVVRDRKSDSSIPPVEDVESTCNIIPSQSNTQPGTRQGTCEAHGFRRFVARLRSILGRYPILRLLIGNHTPVVTGRRSSQVFVRESFRDSQPSRQRSGPKLSLTQRLKRAQTMPRLAKPATTVTRVVRFKNVPNRFNLTIRSVE